MNPVKAYPLFQSKKNSSPSLYFKKDKDNST